MVDENPTNEVVSTEGGGVTSDSAPSQTSSEPKTSVPEVASQPKEIEMTELNVNKKVDVGRMCTRVHT